MYCYLVRPEIVTSIDVVVVYIRSSNQSSFEDLPIGIGAVVLIPSARSWHVGTGTIFGIETHSYRVCRVVILCQRKTITYAPL
jgi:hypothetical protein